MVSKQAVLRAAVPPQLREWVDNRLISAHIRIVKTMIIGTLLNAAAIVVALFGEIPAGHLALFFASSLAAGFHRMWLAEGISRGRRQKRGRSAGRPSMTATRSSCCARRRWARTTT